jgi:hypothetical protein
MRPHASLTIAVTAITVVAAAAGVSCSKTRKTAAAGSCQEIVSPACQACRDTSTAPFCAAKYITPQASGTIKVNGRKSCCGFEDPTLRVNCENILRCIRSKGCGVGSNPNRCLCGEVDPITCATTRKWPGACTSVYEAALAGAPAVPLIRQFGDLTSPIGIANNTYTCDVDAKCPCDQK